jgi:hypothetical protein
MTMVNLNEESDDPYEKEKKEMSRYFSTLSISMSKVNLLKALNHAIDEFVNHDI